MRSQTVYAEFRRAWFGQSCRDQPSRQAKVHCFRGLELSSVSFVGLHWSNRRRRSASQRYCELRLESESCWLLKIWILCILLKNHIEKCNLKLHLLISSDYSINGKEMRHWEDKYKRDSFKDWAEMGHSMVFSYEFLTSFWLKFMINREGSNPKCDWSSERIHQLISTRDTINNNL